VVSDIEVFDTMRESFAAPAFQKPQNSKAPAVRLKRKVKLEGKWTFATIAKRGDNSSGTTSL
jgi:hypothetical protein